MNKAWKKIMALSIVLLLLAAALTVRQLRSLEWPAVEAQIVAWRIVEHRSQDRPGGPEYPTFRPEMRYRYLGSDGQAQEATRLVSVWSKGRAKPEHLTTEYPAGSHVKVSSDPRHSDQVRLDIGPNLATFWEPLAVFAGAVICGLLAWRARRR